MRISLFSIINQNFFYNFAKAFLFGLIFIFPLFLLPISTNFWVVNKTYLLGFSLFLISIFYLCHSIVIKKIEIPSSFISLILLLFIIFNFLSNYLSASPNFSRWGLLSSSHSLFAYFIYFLLFILVSILIKKEDLTILFLIFLISSFLTLFITFLTIFNIYILPFDFAKFKLFNTIGTAYEFMNWVFFVFVFSLFLLLETRFGSSKINNLITILAILNIILSILYFFIYGFSNIWLLASLIIVLFVAQKYIIKTPLSRNEIFLLILFIVFIIFYILSPFLTPAFVNIFKLPNIIDVRPSLITTLKIFANERGFKNILLGEGPNTFIYIWLKNKPPEINQTNFANFRFDQAHNYLTTLLLEGGLVNFSLFLFIILLIILTFLLKGQTIKENELVIFMSLLAVVLTLIYYPAGLVNLSIFFILLSLLGVLREEKREIDFSNFSLLKLIGSYVGLMSLILIFIFLSYLLTTKYLANIYYQKGLVDFDNNNLLSSLQKISLAVNLDPTVDLYQRDLSTVLLKRAIELNNLINTQKAQQTQQVQQVQQELFNLVSSALQLLNNAVNLNKTEPLNYLNLYSLYLTLGTSSENVSLAIENIQKAITYEKNNPSYYINLAMLYSQIQQKNKALEALQNAKKLNPFDPQIDKMIQDILSQ